MHLANRDAWNVGLGFEEFRETCKLAATVDCSAVCWCSLGKVECFNIKSAKCCEEGDCVPALASRIASKIERLLEESC